MILRDIRRTSATDQNSTMDERIVCIIDDNKNKWNRDVDGVPVVGGRNSIIENVREYNVDKIYIALPSMVEPLV